MPMRERQRETRPYTLYCRACFPDIHLFCLQIHLVARSGAEQFTVHTAEMQLRVIIGFLDLHRLPILQKSKRQ